MRIVELDRDLHRKAAELTVGGQVPFDQILQRGRDEEIFLTQPELASGRALVVRVQEFADRFRAGLLGAGAEVIAGVEDIELHRIRRARRPQPQRVDVLTAPADDRGVIGDSLHGFRGMPDRAIATLVVDMFDAAAEVHVIEHFRALKLPGIAEAQPDVRIFLLPAVVDDLPEQAEIITDAVPHRGDRERRHAFHEAGGEPSQAAIAERRIRLALAQGFQTDAEVAQRHLVYRQQPHIVERIGEEAADQKFQREVIDPLAAGVIAHLFRRQPAMHDAVAQRQCRRHVPVVLGRHSGVLAQGQPQLGEDCTLDLGQRQLVDRLAGGRIVERLVCHLQFLTVRLTQIISTISAV